MESAKSDMRHQGARPKEKVSSTGEDSIGYGKFRLTLESLLTGQNAVTLATWFEYPPAKIDRISNSDNPSRVLVQYMDERGEISPNDISRLIKALENETVGLGGVAVKVNESFKLHQPMIVHSTPVTNEKKTQFVKELKQTYTNLCGGILPVPFLRDKYDIDKLFVESGIEFLEDEHGGDKEKEKWTEIRNHKTIFTDPRIQSKRRIVDGEPGYGKSTLVLQITHDWCQEKAPMKDFELLILLRLRQFRKEQTVYSAIKNFLLPKDSKLTEDDIKSILDISSTIILLDGYDEYPDRGNEDTDIEHIIRGDMFRKHEVVLTTRTTFLPPNYSRDTKRIRLTGFDDSARDKYVRNIVTVRCPEDADKIHQFLKVNPVPADLCTNPLFFAMISYMVYKKERFYNLNSVTEFFEHMITCIYSHQQIKEVRGEETKLDHSMLCKIAFEGLSVATQQLSWAKKELKGKLGQNLYYEYVRTGILIEEEDYDYDSKKYETEVRFYHKLFAEWFAAHYFAERTAMPEPQLTTFWRNIRQKATNRSLSHMLETLDPTDLHYMYRFACGLNEDAAIKIINHLGQHERYNKYTLLCMAESDGCLQEVLNTVKRLCLRGIQIKRSDSLLLQRSTIELIKFASSRKIPIKRVMLLQCLDVETSGSLRVKPFYLSLPVSGTLSELLIQDSKDIITKQEISSILQYSAACLGLKNLRIYDCLMPGHIEVTESLSFLRSREYFQVEWLRSGMGHFFLNLESGQWKDVGTSFTRDNSLEQEPWYHGTVSRKQAEDLLEKEGDFIVRLKSDRSGQYILSCRSPEKVRHFPVIQRKDIKYRLESDWFNSMKDLIHYFMNTAKPLTSESNAVIRNPVFKDKDTNDL